MDIPPIKTDADYPKDILTNRRAVLVHPAPKTPERPRRP